jgi:7tm Chemosensory receptor
LLHKIKVLSNIEDEDDLDDCIFESFSLQMMHQKIEFSAGGLFPINMKIITLVSVFQGSFNPINRNALLFVVTDIGHYHKLPSDIHSNNANIGFVKYYDYKGLLTAMSSSQGKVNLN